MKTMNHTIRRAGVLAALVIAGTSAGCASSPGESRPLSSDSSCSERYDAVMDSPSVRERGSDGIVSRSEWIANCEGS